MASFFVPAGQIKQGKVIISGSDVQHISNVLRLEPGNIITVLNGQGKGYRAKLDKIGKKQVECTILEEFTAAGEPPLQITLVQGLPKGDKMEMIIQKCTELGVTAIVPLCSERSVVKPVPDRMQKRRLRWQRVALEAARQCGRAIVPQVGEPVKLADVLITIPPDALKLMLWEDEQKVFLKQVLRTAMPADVFLFIGPEGGFAPEEAALARDYGVITVSLGSRVLRTETAGLAAVAMILYELGDLGGA